MTTSVPGAGVRRGMALLGVLALAWTFLHVGLTALALTTGSTTGSTTEALRVMTYCSPLMAALSFCAAALAFSGRAAARRPGLAGAAFLVLALVSAVLVAGCAVLLLRDAGWWVLWWVGVNVPLLVALAVCRRVFRAAQRQRFDAGPGPAGADPA
jgi:hypothetical protein